MAAPSSKTIKSLDGKWQINKTLSDATDPVLALQGIGWVLRKTVSMATITQHLKTSHDPEGATHITIEQTLSGGMKGTTENRTLDWTDRPHSDWLFGNVNGKSRYTTLEKMTEETKGKNDAGLEEDVKFLAEGWLPETEQGDVVESYVVNEEKGWTAWQVWGFAQIEVEGEKQRWFVRRFVVRKGQEVARIRLAYSWQGELDA